MSSVVRSLALLPPTREEMTLERTLSGHSKAINAMLVARDGSILVSVGGCGPSSVLL